MTAIAAILALVVAVFAASLVRGAAINRRYPPQGKFRPVAGARMHLVQTGRPDGPTVLLVHGASSALDDQIAALAAAFGQRYRVVAVDRPGQGWSDRPGGARDASLIRQAGMIVDAARSVGVERAIVVGHSFGAAVTAAMALEYPQFVQGVVFVAPATHPWPGGVAWYYRLAASPVLGHIFCQLVAPLAGSILLSPGIRAVFHPRQPPQDYDRRTGAARAVTSARFRANAQDVAALHANVSELSRRYKDIEAPCVIVTGDRDSVVWPSIHAEGLARDIAGARLIVLPGAGHMPHHSRPDVVLAAVDDVAAG